MAKNGMTCRLIFHRPPNRAVRDRRAGLLHRHPLVEAPRQEHVAEVHVVIASAEVQPMRQSIGFHERVCA